MRAQAEIEPFYSHVRKQELHSIQYRIQRILSELGWPHGDFFDREQDIFIEQKERLELAELLEDLRNEILAKAEDPKGNSEGDGGKPGAFEIQF